MYTEQIGSVGRAAAGASIAGAASVPTRGIDPPNTESPRPEGWIAHRDEYILRLAFPGLMGDVMPHALVASTMLLMFADHNTIEQALTLEHNVLARRAYDVDVTVLDAASQRASLMQWALDTILTHLCAPLRQVVGQTILEHRAVQSVQPQRPDRGEDPKGAGARPARTYRRKAAKKGRR